MSTLTIYAGINGAGKSTLHQFQSITNGSGAYGVRINPDEILKEFSGNYNDDIDIIRSGRIAIDKLKKCLDNNVSFNWETTILSHFVLNYIEKAKSQGYTVNINFIGVNDIEQSFSRIRLRVLTGGHNVPKHFVQYRFDHQFDNMDAAIALADRIYFYDNSTTMKLVGSCINHNITFFDQNVPWASKVLSQCPTYKPLKNQQPQSTTI